MRRTLGVVLAGMLVAGCGGASSPGADADPGTVDPGDVATADDGVPPRDSLSDGVPDAEPDARPSDPGEPVDAGPDAKDVPHADTAPDASPDPAPDVPTADPGADPGAHVDAGTDARDALPPDPGSCRPDCTGRQCGDDGCGGDCGTCGDSERCEANRCWARYCAVGCSTAADCASPPENGPYSADNYACASGGCHYLGCHDDAECQAVGGGFANGKCRDWGTGGRYCAVGCATAADCASPPENGPYSADHYACDSGACRYLGCGTDAECRALGGSWATARCVFQDPWGAFCSTGCSKAADCASAEDGPYSAENYACESGGCRYLGCRSDAECRELGGTWASAVCR